MATRTAPTVDGTPDYYMVSIASIDASGDPKTDSYTILAADYTAAKVEALVDAIQDGSQASVWKVEVSATYVGDEDASNADAGNRSSIQDVVNLRAKNASVNLAYTGLLRAPVDAIFVADGDTIDPGSTELAAILTAFLALKPNYTFRSARFNERQQKNEAVKF